MRMNVQYLQSRGGKLRYRRRIPERLQEQFDEKTEFVQALHLPVGQELRAVARVKEIDKRVSLMMLQAEKTALGKADAHTMALAAQQWALENKYIGYDRSGVQCDEDEHESDYDLWLGDVIWQARKRLGPNADVELSDLSTDDRMKIETVRQGKRVETPLTLQRAVEAYTEHRRGGDLGDGQRDALGRLDRWLQTSGACARYNAERHIQLDDLSRADATKFVTSQHAEENHAAGRSSEH